MRFPSKSSHFCSKISCTDPQKISFLGSSSMGVFDCPVTLECKYAAEEWLQSKDPLIRDFGARHWWKCGGSAG